MLPYLSKLPGDADGPAEAIASNQQGLHTPAPEMAKCKDVKMAHDPLPGDDMAVHCIVLQRAAHIRMIDNPLLVNTTGACESICK